MTPFTRGRILYIYVPRQSGGVIERTTGSRDDKIGKQIAGKIARLVQKLAAEHRWVLLNAVTDKPCRLTLKRLYAASITDPSLKSLERDLATPDVVPLIDEFLEDRNKRLGKRASGPRTEYISAIKRFTGDSCPASRITFEAIDAWLTNLPDDWTSTYRRDVLLRFSSFLNFLVRRRVIASNPVNDIEKPMRSEAPIVYESVEIDALISEKAIDDRYAALFALIHGSGADVTPATRMHVRDLNLTARSDGWGLAHVPGTKTAKRDRHEVRIEPWATVILRSYTRHMLPAAPLFEGITRYMAAWHHKSAAKLAKVPSYTLRHARHSWAIRARLERGETWEEIGQQLGTSAYVVAKVYAAFKPREISAPSAVVEERA